MGRIGKIIPQGFLSQRLFGRMYSCLGEGHAVSLLGLLILLVVTISL